MIPYVELPTLSLGPLEIAPYGALMVTAIVAGAITCAARSRAHGFAPVDALRGYWWVVVVGLVTAHVADVLLSNRELLGDRGLIVLLEISQGMMSYGGFAGGMAAAAGYCRVRRLPTLSYADLLAECFVVAWIFGRAGCALAHDHPGALTSFPLAVAYPKGPRHDLGIYEVLLAALVLLPVTIATVARRPAAGVLALRVALIYTPVRFGLDFLRAQDLAGADLRYIGLTAAQYGSLAFFCIAAYLLRTLNKGALRVEAR